MWKFINRLTNFLLTVIGAVVIVFGIFVYSTEFSGEGKQNKGLDEGFFRQIRTYELSNLTSLIIIGIILCIILFVVKVTTSKILRLEEQAKNLVVYQESTSSKLTEIVDNITVEHGKNKILELMNTFMGNHSEIISIQLYEYHERKKGSKVEFEIKPTGIYQTRAGEVANLIHEIYCINDKQIAEYRKIIKDYENEKNKKTETAILNYIKKLTQQLSKKAKNKDRNTVDSLNKYVLLTLTTQYFLDDVTFRNENLDTEFIKELNNQKRTGLFRGIIHNNYYKFIHTGESHKGKRVYVTRCLPIENKKHTFIIVFDPSISKKDGFGDYLNEIGDQFYNLLSDKTEVVYNDINKP